MHIRTQVVAQFQVILIQHQQSMASPMHPWKIQRHIIGNVCLNNPFTAGAGNDVLSRVLQVENVAESLLRQDAGLDSGVDDKFQRQHSVQYHRYNDQAVPQFKGYLNFPPPLFKNKTQGSLTVTNLAQQEKNG